MDTVTTGTAARSLGTSVPRVRRALRALDLQPARTTGGQVRLRAGEVARLAEVLGSAPPVAGLGREEVFVLAALSRRPFGLSSARAAARAAGVSPTTAAGALRRLDRLGYVHLAASLQLGGRVQAPAAWEVEWQGEPWQRVAGRIGTVQTPAPRGPRATERDLPRRFDHLFWNVDPRKLDLVRDGRYIAARLLGSNDSQALAWMVRAIPPQVIEEAAQVRGTSARDRALARNIAAAA